QVQVFVFRPQQPFQSAQRLIRIDYFKFGQRQRLASQQLFHLVQVIPVNMTVAKSVYELADCQTANVCDQMRQQGVGTYVEWHSQKRIGRALVKLAMKNSFLLNLELKQGVTWRQVHRVAHAWVPAADDQAS